MDPLEIACTIQSGDALLVVDVQNDFLPGGSLAVPSGDEVLPVLNHVISVFSRRKLPILATRDWHPSNHCSFAENGGPWPSHCVAETVGARFSDELRLPASTRVISKASRTEQDAYSGFEGTELSKVLREAGVRRVFVGGLATDYCVLRTVEDALRNDFKVVLLIDGVRAVNVAPEDGVKAIAEMQRLGAIPVSGKQISE